MTPKKNTKKNDNDIFEHGTQMGNAIDDEIDINVELIEEQMGVMLDKGLAVASLGTAAEYLQTVATVDQIEKLNGDRLKELIDAQVVEQAAFLQKVKPLGVAPYVAVAQILPLFVGVHAATEYLAEN